MINFTRRRILGSAAATCAMFMTPSVFSFSGGGQKSPIIPTSNGPVQGRIEDGVMVFRGIRYAAPPTGERRFKPPVRPEPWSRVVQAESFGAAAIQEPGQPDMPADETHSEDCVFLNVWSENVAGRRPVMVWLHGGAFSSGAAGRPTYWGDVLARNGVVMVSLNHRLNVFGFTQLPEEWGEEYRSSGLAGMLDIVMALEWVRDNISEFGGDPDNVTIFGESGGGAKVSLLLGMPSAKGLYHKAIIQSGAGLDAAPRSYAQSLGASLMDNLGIQAGDKASLASIDAQTIFAMQQTAIDEVKHLVEPGGFLTDGFVPSIDEKELLRGPFTPTAQEMARDIPLLIGTNKDENTLFLVGKPGFNETTESDFEEAARKMFADKAGAVIREIKAAYPEYSPPYLLAQLHTANMFWRDTIILADRKYEQNGAPVYMYRMDWGSGVLKAGHALELSLVFGTYDHVRHFVGPGPEPKRMCDQMHPAWIAFAKSGDPNHPAMPYWPQYDTRERNTMIFNIESHVESDPLGRLRTLLS